MKNKECCEKWVFDGFQASMTLPGRHEEATACPCGQKVRVIYDALPCLGGDVVISIVDIVTE